MTSGLLGPPQGRLPSLVDQRASPRLLTAHIDDVGDVRRRFSVHPRTALAEHPTKRLHGFEQTIGKPPDTKIRDHDVVNHLLEKRLRGDFAEPFANDDLDLPLGHDHKDQDPVVQLALADPQMVEVFSCELRGFFSVVQQHDADLRRGLAIDLLDQLSKPGLLRSTDQVGDLVPPAANPHVSLPAPRRSTAPRPPPPQTPQTPPPPTPPPPTPPPPKTTRGTRKNGPPPVNSCPPPTTNQGKN